jgi:hypothetical protein
MKSASGIHIAEFLLRLPLYRKRGIPDEHHHGDPMPTPLSALVATGALLVAGMASTESIGQFAHTMNHFVSTSEKNSEPNPFDSLKNSLLRPFLKCTTRFPSLKLKSRPCLLSVSLTSL